VPVGERKLLSKAQNDISASSVTLMLTSRSQLFGQPETEPNSSERGSAPSNYITNNLANEDYEFIRKLVFDRSRINLGSGKKELVASRIAKRLRVLRLNSFADYCDYVRSSRGEEEITDLLDVISTNVTEFFREPAHFDFLQQKALPEWTKLPASARNPYRVWSAACSSGEEPYTLAIVLAEFFQNRGAHAWKVDASDISTRMLDRARQGIYRSDKVQLPSTDLLRRYFQKGVGAYAGQFRAKPEIREKISFHHLNLFHPFPFSSPFDAIFCRNVMIYFDRPTQEDLVTRLRELLVPGGYLIVGHSESLVAIRHGLKSVQPSIYRRE
jgi:chemotaxis protein methyltransferase CheR